MNPDLIETREEAVALVDADLITIQDYVMLCRFKGWNPTGSAAALAPADRKAQPQPERAETPRLSAQRRPTVPEVSRREPLPPARGRGLPLSVRSA